jgi:acylphosphatase
METLITWHVNVTGRVQGVYYRTHTVEAATRLGICGWVLNERDGSVSAVLQHRDPAVLSQLLTVMRDGPPASRVDDVEVSPVETSEIYRRFEIRFPGPWRDRAADLASR